MLLNDKTNQNKVKKAQNILRALGHQLRRSILETIENNDNKITVTEIYVKLRLEQSVASQHLAILRRAGIVETERDGKLIYYSVRKTVLADVLQLCDDLAEKTK